MVLKIQKPISTNDPNSPWLLYNKDRTRQFTMADALMPTRIRSHIEAHNGKAFWHVRVIASRLMFIRPAATQDW